MTRFPLIQRRKVLKAMIMSELKYLQRDLRRLVYIGTVIHKWDLHGSVKNFIYYFYLILKNFRPF
jgi:hypothetical protein